MMADRRKTRMNGKQTLQWKCRDRTIRLGRFPRIMGILNVTPDSFSDSGLYADRDKAVAHGLQMVAEGADIVDVGGESTRPGALAVSAREEIKRVVPVIAELQHRTDVAISVDTTKGDVAREALEAGARIVNDVSALTHDPAMVDVVRESGSGVILMHMQGTPRTMQKRPRYNEVVGDVVGYLKGRVEDLVARGVDPASLSVDPGIGFGKTVRHNLELLAGLAALGELGLPVIVGLSRKSFLGRLTRRPVEGRLAGSLAALVFSILGGAHVVRVHDVEESKDAARVAATLRAVQGHRRRGT